MKGFICGTGELAEVMPKFYDEVAPLLANGKIAIREHRYSLEKAGEALLSVHTGKNVGKAVIIVSDGD